MKPLTAVLSYLPGSFFEKTLLALTKSSLVERVAVANPEPVPLRGVGLRVIPAGPLHASDTLRPLLAEIQTKYFLFFIGSEPIALEPQALERIVEVAESTGAGIVYSDFYDGGKSEKALHPLNDYQDGSVRDDFDFGSMMLFSTQAVQDSLKKYGPLPAVHFAGLYDLRLKVSIGYSVHHLREPLYTTLEEDEPAGDRKRFAYLDPRHEGVQKEMEAVFTEYLKRIGAFLPPGSFQRVPPDPGGFPVEASVVIPVRNREQTIAEAVSSALSQKTDFPFNVLVVDNHSTDRTTSVLFDLAGRCPALKHIIPRRTDLGIGGCWNQALEHEACGRYAVQLDSDDLYSSAHTLQRMVDKLRQGDHALVVGSYTLVDSSLKEIPPGLIDHREWTDENGRNNALRINGLGAPRAFRTGLMRKIGFLNVSYAEDYAAALRICREYRIGRIYENLYLCRRWSGNTDAALTLEAANRNDAFKDKIRTAEIAARKKMNQEGGGSVSAGEASGKP